MATLTNNQTQRKCILKAHHSFGRLKSSVDTFVPDPYISKVHAFIEWSGQHWLLRDVSTNGTWLNGNKASKEHPQELKVNDVISLASQPGNAYTVTDVKPPCDLLVPINHEDDAIELEYHHLLSCHGTPKMVLSYNNKTYSWWQEVLSNNLDDSAQATELSDNAQLHIDNLIWQLQVNRTIDDTCVLNPNIMSLNDITFNFDTSLDEETTQLTLGCSDNKYDLAIRSHHYLTLYLARQRAHDITQQLDDSEQGWVYAEVLAKELGLEANHLNIQIYRIRKQFADMLGEVCDSTAIIERKGGKLRLAAKRVMITKGGLLEFDATSWQHEVAHS